MNIERRQRARIVEHDTRTIGETQCGAREPRKRIRCGADDPITIHAEVNMYDSTVIEMDELMLAAPFDVAHAGAAKRT
jgi:hypothetical protein